MSLFHCLGRIKESVQDRGTNIRFVTKLSLSARTC